MLSLHAQSCSLQLQIKNSCERSDGSSIFDKFLLPRVAVTQTMTPNRLQREESANANWPSKNASKKHQVQATNTIKVFPCSNKQQTAASNSTADRNIYHVLIMANRVRTTGSNFILASLLASLSYCPLSL